MRTLIKSETITQKNDDTFPNAQCGTISKAVLSYSTRGPVAGELIEIEHLVWLVLHGDCRRRQIELRLAGYTGGAVPWGVRWGGAEQMLFEKNLRLRPRFGGRGRCLNQHHFDVVRQARRMKRIFFQHTGHKKSCKGQRLQLPRLWAAFDKSIAESITGDGPEFCGMCHVTGQSKSELLGSSKRSLGDSVAYPLDWVSHTWQQITQIFAELKGLPRFQVIPIDESRESLAGYRGACEFDFYHSRFREHACKPTMPIEQVCQ